MSEITNQVSDHQTPASDLRSLPADLRNPASDLRSLTSGRCPSNPSAPRLPAPVRITDQVWPEGTVPVVSVFCITYNHVNFIRDAIEGFLMQETTFPVEIFIHDDASTDGTAEIVKEYAEKYPKLFWTVLQTENQWSKGNPNAYFFGLVQKQRGEFIALCEGDDYWTSPSKLEEQVAVLNADPTVSLVFHNCWMMHPESRRDYFLNHRIEKERFTLDDVIDREWFMGTASLVFRKFDPLPPEISRYAVGGDMLIQLGACLNGDALYLDHVYSVYRRHAQGVSDRYWQPGPALYETLRPNHIWMYWMFGESACPSCAKDALYRKIRGLTRQIMDYALVSDKITSHQAVPTGLDSYFKGLLLKNKPPEIGTSVLERGSVLAELSKTEAGLCWADYRRKKSSERRSRAKARARSVLRKCVVLLWPR